MNKKIKGGDIFYDNVSTLFLCLSVGLVFLLSIGYTIYALYDGFTNGNYNIILGNPGLILISLLLVSLVFLFGSVFIYNFVIAVSEVVSIMVETILNGKKV
jgi:hypothetical protein